MEASSKDTVKTVLTAFAFTFLNILLADHRFIVINSFVFLNFLCRYGFSNTFISILTIILHSSLENVNY